MKPIQLNTVQPVKTQVLVHRPLEVVQMTKSQVGIFLVFLRQVPTAISIPFTQEKQPCLSNSSLPSSSHFSSTLSVMWQPTPTPSPAQGSATTLTTPPSSGAPQTVPITASPPAAASTSTRRPLSKAHGSPRESSCQMAVVLIMQGLMMPGRRTCITSGTPTIVIMRLVRSGRRRA